MAESNGSSAGTTPSTSSTAAAPTLNGSTILSALPGLGRVAFASGRRILEWTVTSYVDTNRRIFRAIASGQSPTLVIQQTVADFRNMARQALGLASDVTGIGGQSEPSKHAGATVEELRRRGAELLYESADVWFTENTHPAYERILEELAPDEARVLRFLAMEGPQPSVDVRTGRPLGIGSERIAGGLSMIGLQAGVRNLDRTNAYLNNLFRLGLIWFSREEVDDPARYQVVEVQPEVAEAIKRAGRAGKTVRRSIHLTEFGEDFCRTCLPIDPLP